MNVLINIGTATLAACHYLNDGEQFCILSSLLVEGADAGSTSWIP